MRSALTLVCALGFAFLGLSASPPAQAHWERRGNGMDPYAYQFEPRGYYPYYNSRYWRPAWVLRQRRACCRPDPVLPPYYAAWGYPRKYYKHRAWHHRHHGRHWHHHW